MEPAAGVAVRVVTTVSQAAGVGHVLAVDAVAVDTDSQGIGVQWSENSNADDFSKNLIRARCEGRFNTSVYSPLRVVSPRPDGLALHAGYRLSAPCVMEARGWPVYFPVIGHPRRAHWGDEAPARCRGPRPDRPAAPSPAPRCPPPSRPTTVSSSPRPTR